MKVRDAFVAHPEIIQAFVDENPFGFSPDELAIIDSWRHFLKETFLLMEHGRNYSVLMNLSGPPIAYAVLALSQSFKELLGSEVPRMVETVLLPFEDKIVYDALLCTFGLTVTTDLRRAIDERLKKATALFGLVTSLPMEHVSRQTATPPPKAPTKEAKDDALGAVQSLIDAFCKEHLNEEYAAVCRKMAEMLHRKRPSPLLQGKPNAWASGIIRAVGGQNFLHDKTQTPYLRSADIDRLLGTSPSSGAAKLSAIRKMLKLHPFDPTWTLPSRLEDNPLVWMLKVNGFLMDIRMAPREAQVVAFEKGLIPYIPADRNAGER